MAVDIQVVFPQQTIKLIDVSELQGYTPRVLYVTGEDFSAIDEILINDEPAPIFYLLGLKAMVVQVPPTEQNSVINSFVVLSNRLTLSAESLLRYRLGPIGRKVTGMLRLVQLFTKSMLQTPGSDIFNQSFGGGLLRKVGRQISRTGQGLVGEVVLAVDNTARQLIAVQSKVPSIPLSERLLAAKVIGSKFDSNELALTVDVELLNQLGTRGQVNLLV